MQRPVRGSGGRERLPTDVYVLAVIAFCVAVGFGVVIPVLPVFARSFGVGQLETGLVISSFAVMRLVMSPFTGPLIDRLGERPVLAAGITIVAISSAVMGLAQNYPQLLVFRAAGGIGSSMFTVSAMTLLIRTVDSSRRGRATGTFQTGFLIGNMAGPAVGGLLAAVSIRAPFFFYAFTLLVAAVVAMAKLHAPRFAAPPAVSPDGTPAAQDDARPFRRVLGDNRYQAALAANFATGWTSHGVRSALIPVLVVEVLHHEPVWTGISLAIASVVQTIALRPAGTFVDRVGRRPAMIAGSLVCGAAMTSVAFVPNIWLLVAAMSVYAVGASLMGTAPAATVGDVSGSRSGTPVAVFSMTADAGQIAGPLVAGWVTDEFSMAWAIIVSSGWMLVSALAALRMDRTPMAERRDDDATTADDATTEEEGHR